jgi:hypothetical protein
MHIARSSREPPGGSSRAGETRCAIRFARLSSLEPSSLPTKIPRSSGGDRFGGREEKKPESCLGRARRASPGVRGGHPYAARSKPRDAPRASELVLRDCRSSRSIGPAHPWPADECKKIHPLADRMEPPFHARIAHRGQGPAARGATNRRPVRSPSVTYLAPDRTSDDLLL